jgi:hypothetical protein
MPKLPSGLKLYIAKLAVIDFKGRTDWFRCPSGHFWFMTPNLTVSPPPYSLTTEITFDFISAPVPRSRREAAQFVHVYLEDPTHGIFWRGDWLDTFEQTYSLSADDLKFWKEWMAANEDFLDDTIVACQAQAAHNSQLSGYKGLPGEYMIFMTLPANSVGKEIVPSRIQHYKLSQLMVRKHRLPESVRQMDYELAVNYVAGDLQDHGYRITFANRSRTESPSLVAESRNGKIAVQVTVARAPEDASYSQSDIARIKAYAPAGTSEYGFAAVGLLPTAPRSPNGDPGFHIKYAGIKKV